MTRRFLARFIPLALLVLPALPAQAGDCRAAIRQAERAEALPRGLLAAMARVESGEQGRQDGWAWTVQAEGRSRHFDSRAEALHHARALQARGVRRIDVGCLQVNLLYHGQAFTSLEEAFSPQANARYAARFLRSLREQRGGWMQAVGAYHSGQPERSRAYQDKVRQAMRQPRGGPS
ncbi:transglycosylase SLT domain-containing protein [Roseomonas sp. GC11]|uniref:transglycosylase SLT domain-containing protein n=1 Tax=Roseomonas sp. GC11 TaxID=2950546 RepID=UPI00210D4D0F|nr:transglycosylase SLT domain-containing protein [Roseomonas sp. GC11]MCQ4159705.1 transglycosylase SLT domain-containing protein [Roseomonas sp. GC11]